MLFDKWRFNISQDWKVLINNFNNASLDTIPDGILQALSFYFTLLNYLKEKTLRFIYITDNLDLMIKPVDNGQPIINSKDKKVKK